MAKCIKCGKNYISKECPYCNNENIYIKPNLSEKDKLFKTIRYFIIGIIGIAIITTIADIYFTNTAVNMVKPMAKVMTDMDKQLLNTINKITNFK